LARPAWSAALRPLFEDELEPEDAVPELLELELLELQAASTKVATTASSTPVCRKVREKRLRAWLTGVIHPPRGILVTMISEFDSYHDHHFLASGQEAAGTLA
jgi:hypothetical protein